MATVAFRDDDVYVRSRTERGGTSSSPRKGLVLIVGSLEATELEDGGRRRRLVDLSTFQTGTDNVEAATMVFSVVMVSRCRVIWNV